MLAATRNAFDLELQKHFAQVSRHLLAPFPKLVETLNYSLQAGGKRVRALLALASCQACGGDQIAATKLGIALEYLHCYSLIHDDLPALDNDDLRRGLPTSHKRFGEARAVLAGDALHSLCFTTLGELETPHRHQIIQLLANAALLMVGGQALDIAASMEHTSAAGLETIYRNKTGALIRASVLGGGLCAVAIRPQQQQALERIGELLGLAFQITDDLLEHSQSSTQLGKSNSSDQRNTQPTYPVIVGEAKSRQLIADCNAQTRELLIHFPSQQSRLLVNICDFLLHRTC